MDLSTVIHRYRYDYEQRYAGSITRAQHHALHAILACRGGRYGKMHLDCDQCGHECELNHSCGHRFCHRCKHHDTARWLERQTQKLIPCDYFLVTFTIPQPLRLLAYRHQALFYKHLFDCAVSTLKDFVANDKHLNAEAGMTAVLHTHSRRLNYHPHIHVVIPAGGLNHKRKCWVGQRKRFLFPQRNLARVFRARLLESIRLSGLTIPSALAKQWVVDCRHTGRGSSALKYLSRYLYRGVMSEEQIVSDDGALVTFKYRCSQSAKWKRRTLPGADFLRLLFRHVLPKGLRRVRDYGFLHGNAKLKLQRIQLILKVTIPPIEPLQRPPLLCKQCQQPMRITAFIRPDPLPG